MCHDAYSSGVVDEVTLGVETDDVGVLPVNEMSGWESESEPMSVRVVTSSPRITANS